MYICIDDDQSTPGEGLLPRGGKLAVKYERHDGGSKKGIHINMFTTELSLSPHSS